MPVRRVPASQTHVGGLLVILIGFLLTTLEPLHAQTGRQLAWDESPTSSVTGFAVTVDGVRTDYGLAPQQSDGSCSCSIPLPFSSGRHIVTVGAYNSIGETSSAPLIVGPTANAGGPYTGQAGTSLTVSAADSTDATGTIASYVWNWGDGTSNTSSATATASHTYASVGAFTITLTVTDNFPASHTATTTAIIALALPQPPGVPASPAPASGATGVGTTPTLTWVASDATSYDVRFGATNPPSLTAGGLSSASYTPAFVLTPATTYYWQVVAHNGGGTTAGPIWSFQTASQTPPADAGDIVIYASDLLSGSWHGAWTTASDATSPNGIKLVTADAGWASTDAPLAAPIHYIDVPFNPTPGTPYTLWLRLRAQDNSKWNDAVWVQFSDAQVNGSPIYPLNSTSALLINLATDAVAGSLNGWGWQNGAYWFSQPATVTFTASSPHTLRIQVREDGVQIDQILLSPSTYLSTPPGPPTNDRTILPKDNKPAVPASPSPPNAATNVSTTPTLTWTAGGATSYDVSFGVTNPPPLVTSDRAMASYTPSPALTSNTTYYWQVVARNSSGTTAGPVWSFTTAPPTSSSGDIVIYASDLLNGSWHGAWTTASDATSPNGIKLVTPDAGWASTDAPLAAPIHYIDVPFNPTPGTPYTLWLRVRAQDNSKWNDAVWVQFSDARVNGSPIYPLNSTSALLINLATDAVAASLNGWGWQNGAYWFSQPATVTFTASSPHTLRIQVREDGVQIDQIVLSPGTYLSTPPGPPTNDSTIIRK
jgi:PKD repeat protein